MTLIDVLLNMNNLKFNMTKFITSRNIKVNKVTAEILKEENNIKEDNNKESWIIDSGTGINLSKNIKKKKKKKKNTIKH